MSSSGSILEVRDLNVAYGHAPPVVSGVSFDLPPGHTLALVGESGSGKSTIARTVVGHVRGLRGSVRLAGEEITHARGRRLRAARRQMQLVPQDPYSSLNPRMTIGQVIDEGCDPSSPRTDRDREVLRLLDAVALPSDVRDRRPHELSGGQRQRVALARALAVRPAVLIADEITSALDCSVQAGILNLLLALRAEFALSMLFISHDLAVVAQVCDTVAVLRGGELVEHGPRDRVFRSPSHPYTRLLLDSAPRLNYASAP